MAAKRKSSKRSQGASRPAKKMVSLACAGPRGKVVEKRVPAEVFGRWAVHAGPKGAKASGYTVTHVATGHSLIKGAPQEIARAAARRLAKMPLLEVPKVDFTTPAAKEMLAVVTSDLDRHGVGKLKVFVEANLYRPATLASKIAKWTPDSEFTPRDWPVRGGKARAGKRSAAPAPKPKARPKAKGVSLADLVRLAYESNPDVDPPDAATVHAREDCLW